MKTCRRPTVDKSRNITRRCRRGIDLQLSVKPGHSSLEADMSKNSVSMVAVLLAALCSPSVPEKTRAAEATKILILFEGHRVFTTDQLRSAMLLGEPFHAIRS